VDPPCVLLLYVRPCIVLNLKFANYYELSGLGAYIINVLMTTQVHYPMEAIHSVPFSDSKVQLLEAQVGYNPFLILWYMVSH